MAVFQEAELTRPFFIETYRSRRRLTRRPEHRWRAVHRSNGEILASGEGYTDREDMMDTIDVLFGAGIETMDVAQ